MKKYLLSSLLLIIVILLANCKKSNIDYYDESKIVNNTPGLSIYKTNGDYIDFIHFQLDSNNIITMSPCYKPTNSSRIIIDKDGNVHQNFRYKLKSGYIVSNNANISYTYTDITFQEYFDITNESGEWYIPNSLLKQRIVDRNPFTEYYYLNGLNGNYREFTLGEINDLAEEGNLESVFTKLK